MDIFWANAGALSLPSSQRVEVLVHDGSSDLRLWPGPGADRNLVEAYGPFVREALEAQREKYGGSVRIGEAVRIHPGKLHCNYLLWVATRGPEQKGQQADAPSITIIEQAVTRCLEVAASNASISIAFSALGDGPKAAPAEERLAAIVRAAHQYYETCVSTGRPPRLEIVRVCDPRSGVTAAARRLVGRLAHSAPEVSPAPSSSARPTAERSLSRGAASAGRSRAGAPAAKRRGAEVLDEAEVAHKRVTAKPYDRSQRYKETDWFVHARFGVGQVKRVTPDGAIEVLFEDGSTKKMLHAHSG